ncbi:MAG: hypothetical protein ACI83D_000235 [Planctomycetota bacterium]|jgi:hypothetical protein
MEMSRDLTEDQRRLYDEFQFKNISELHIRLWNNYYDNLEHCGLHEQTPEEYLQSKKVTNTLA